LSATPHLRRDAHQASPEVSLLEVEAELRAHRWDLKFAPAVEARFEADEGQARRTGLIQAGLLGLLIYNCFLFNDWTMRGPAMFGQSVAWRGLLTGYGLLALGLSWWQVVSPKWREILMASCSVLANFCACMLFQATAAPERAYDPFTFTLVFVACNVSFPLPFREALVSSLIGLVMVFAFVVPDPLPLVAKTSALGMMTGACLFTLQACRRMEASGRQSYLLRLNETLRMAAARHEAEAFARMSLTDPLTELPNRRAMEGALSLMWAGAKAQQGWVSMLIVDVDHFKRYNDRFGHPAGDVCLQRVAAAMRAKLREGDFIARIGGEEFVVLLPGTHDPMVQAMAERMRAAVEQLAMAGGDAERGGVVTVSIGMVAANPAQDCPDPAAMMAAADAALYRAKSQGRNRCVYGAVVAAQVAPSELPSLSSV
jgi:diguanylate cyclase (GGDEF)-like protein